MKFRFGGFLSIGLLVSSCLYAKHEDCFHLLQKDMNYLNQELLPAFESEILELKDRVEQLNKEKDSYGWIKRRRLKTKYEQISRNLYDARQDYQSKKISYQTWKTHLDEEKKLLTLFQKAEKTITHKDFLLQDVDINHLYIDFLISANQDGFPSFSPGWDIHDYEKEPGRFKEKLKRGHHISPQKFIYTIHRSFQDKKLCSSINHKKSNRKPIRSITSHLIRMSKKIKTHDDEFVGKNYYQLCKEVSEKGYRDINTVYDSTYLIP